MRNDELYVLRELLPKRRMIFPYWADQYALMLLAWRVGDGMPIRDLRRSPLAPLLDRPAIRGVLARCGDGVLRARELEAASPRAQKLFRLTLGKWSNPRDWTKWWPQTSRPATNLVLHLNFDRDHNRAHRKLFGIDNAQFCSSIHPVAKAPEYTLAWSRIDLDLGDREALIEEIQGDWVREARDRAEFMSARAWAGAAAASRTRRNGCGIPQHRAARRYARAHVAAYERLWPQAMMAATLWLLREHLGVRRVFYHTFEGGKVLKGCDPPLSLYADLPRKFCFTPTSEPPAILRNCRDPRTRCVLDELSPRFWVLDL